ncbi:chromate transporter [bacterium]|nr:chromate transporter [bacterium]
MSISLWNIYVVFLKVGALLLGGGYVILPLLTAEIVQKRPWITEEELIDYYALSQCLPGIIAVNTAVFTGYKLRGKLGAFAAIVGMCTSPFLAIILLATILDKLTDIPIVLDIFWGVGIGILIMILLTVKEIWCKSIVDKFTFFVFITIFSLTVFADLSPVWAVVISALFGVLYRLYQRRYQ